MNLLEGLGSQQCFYAKFTAKKSGQEVVNFDFQGGKYSNKAELIFWDF